MKDFIKQLILVGESNYKFYETQKDDNEKSEENIFVKIKANELKNNEEQPALLGSLVYDVNWFKSKIDT